MNGSFLVPEWHAPAGVAALSTTRRGGVSRAPYDDGEGGGGLNLGAHVGDDPDSVRANRALLRTRLPDEPAWLSQVHGNRVVHADSAVDAPQADASITSRRGVVCAIQTADCLPVLFCDVAATVVGAAHAGWRGLAGGVLQNTVGAMRTAGARDIIAWLGPAIGPRRFEVGQDVVKAFCAQSPGLRSAFVPREAVPGKHLADIYALARMILAEAGVRQVFGGGRCTVEESRDFYSYRRDGVTGRMASLIWLK
ncbi:MAG TPA: peptidoglycan editing factor PgeF [Noviherbaspirillum sp.]|nr:peptidoglycan editing factor PgeF [Noviherbaspirillum sp.]